jgi:hypothetical protein
MRKACFLHESTKIVSIRESRNRIGEIRISSVMARDPLADFRQTVLKIEKRSVRRSREVGRGEFKMSSLPCGEHASHLFSEEREISNIAYAKEIVMRSGCISESKSVRLPSVE